MEALKESKERRLSNLIKIEFLLVLIFYGVMSIGIHWQINAVQPAPYMDEVFHVPQCQKYCRGLYSEWDPKITTLPGTYIVTTAVLRTLHKFLPVPIEDPCSTFYLRSFSLAVSMLNLFLVFLILGHYSPDSSIAKRAFSALNIATFPVLYFFSFLYYTDAVSTAFLLLMHYCFLSGRFGFSALAGGYSVFTRQTNIIWVLYHGINSILEVLTDKFGEMIFMYPVEYKRYIFGGPKPQLKKGKRSKTTKRPKKTSSKSQLQLPSINRIWLECGDEFGDRGIAYVLVGMAFLMFIVYNGSIVVGDKSAHQATLNFPQIGYFSVVFGAFTAPFLLFRVKSVSKKILEFPLNALTVAGIFAFVIYYNTPVHPYLLADNRHYTFYIWKRFYENTPCFRFLWIPVYVFVWTFIVTRMNVEKMYLFTYVLCTVLNIVPQLLIEFRYFIPAYLFARMTFRNASWAELVMEFFINQFINFATVYLFLFKPFKWSDTAEDQRFMW